MVFNPLRVRLPLTTIMSFVELEISTEFVAPFNEVAVTASAPTLTPALKVGHFGSQITDDRAVAGNRLSAGETRPAADTSKVAPHTTLTAAVPGALLAPRPGAL
jgi:hypothetical protein